MIDTTLLLLRDQLNAYLGTRYGGREPHVVLSALANLDGTTPSGIDNKVVLTLVNIERESAAGPGAQLKPENGGFTRISPALHLNLYVLVSAAFGNNS